MKKLRIALGLLAVVALAGCTAPVPEAAVPEPGATETLPPLGWAPDLELTRTFDDTTCTILLHVSDNAGEPDLVAAAREFLAAGDWSTVEVSLDDMTEAELEAGHAQGRTDADLLTSVLQARIRADLAGAGLTGTWFSTDGRTTCA